MLEQTGNMRPIHQYSVLFLQNSGWLDCEEQTCSNYFQMFARQVNKKTAFYFPLLENSRLGKFTKYIIKWVWPYQVFPGEPNNNNPEKNIYCPTDVSKQQPLINHFGPYSHSKKLHFLKLTQQDLLKFGRWLHCMHCSFPVFAKSPALGASDQGKHWLAVPDTQHTSPWWFLWHPQDWYYPLQKHHIELSTGIGQSSHSTVSCGAKPQWWQPSTHLVQEHGLFHPCHHESLDSWPW